MKLSVSFAALAWVCLASVANAGSITSLLVFGDSLSDTGNLYAVLNKPPAPYYDGRFSNGLLWHEYLAQKLGVPVATHSLGGGTNQAWAGAESGILFAPLGVPNVLTQVAAYLLIKHTVDPNQLVAIWTGGNDYLFGDLDPNQSFPDPAQIVKNIEIAVTALALAGGKEFLVPNLPLLGHSPIVIEKGQPGDVDKINDSIVLYNEMLATQLTALESLLGITIHQVDVATIFNSILADPAKYGISNVTEGAYPNNIPDADQHLFWDYVHPTTRVHEMIGELAFESINPVPEPDSLTLAALGLISFAGLHLRKMRSHVCTAEALSPAKSTR